MKLPRKALGLALPLRLISCGGLFDEQLKSYLSNVVVYATGVA